MKTLILLLLIPMLGTSQPSLFPHVSTGSTAKHVRGFGDLIDFEAYITGTIITDQYADSGAIFSGYAGSGNPDVYDYGAYVYGRVLKSDTWFNPIRLSFVDPLDSTVKKKIRYLGYENAAISDLDWVVANFYDENNNLVFSYASDTYSEQFISIDLGSNAAAYVVFDDSLQTAYVLDSIWFSQDTIETISETMPANEFFTRCYPNPMSDQITVSFSGWESFPQLQLHVLNVLGNHVATVLDVKEGKAFLRRGMMSPGLYIYFFKSEQQVLIQGSFIVH